MKATLDLDASQHAFLRSLLEPARGGAAMMHDDVAVAFYESILDQLGTWRDPVTAVVNEDGMLACPECGSTEIKENGSHPCEWRYSDQLIEEKVLQLDGSFEWYDGDDDGYECGKGHRIDELPEDWEVSYG